MHTPLQVGSASNSASRAATNMSGKKVNQAYKLAKSKKIVLTQQIRFITVKGQALLFWSKKSHFGLSLQKLYKLSR